MKMVSLENLNYNLNSLRQSLCLHVKILAIVKADAYGHGMIDVASLLQSEGVEYFGVASLREAVLLRENGITGNILVLSNVLEDEVPLLFDYDLICTISDPDSLDLIARFAKSMNRAIKIHIKVDTGMGRFGINLKEADALVEHARKEEKIILQGIFSHFATADDDLDFARVQLTRFKEFLIRQENKGISIPLKHIANSAGIVNIGKDAFFNMVRPGLLLYGGFKTDILNTKPVMSVRSKLIFKKKISKGHGVSYGQTFIAPKDMTVGIVPIGYSHGFPRILSGKGEVLVCGKRVKIIGRICMDYSIIDLSGLDYVSLGDEVVLLGRQSDEEITLHDICDKTNQIPYEFLCDMKNYAEYSLGKNTKKYHKAS